MATSTTGPADYLAEELRLGFPEGTEDFVDWEDPQGPGPLMDACGQLLETCGTAGVDELRRELSPLTCSAAGLTIWEQSLGLSNSKIALLGVTERRRAQVLARLRERGVPNRALVQTVLNAFLAYVDQTTIAILESSRADVRAKNQKRWDGPVNFGNGAVPPTATITWTVWDDPKVSPGGVQIDLNVTCADLETLVVTLTSPGGFTYTWPNPSAKPGDFDYGPIGVGARAAGPGGVNLRLYARQFIGRTDIFGTWTMTITSTNVGDNLLSAILFVEGLGRYYDWMGKPWDGLGAAMYEWGVVVDRALLGADFDLDGARLAVKRLSYARSLGNIVRKRMDGLIGIPDDPDTIPDEVIPGV